jgi:hypothetical protein
MLESFLHDFRTRSAQPLTMKPSEQRPEKPLLERLEILDTEKKDSRLPELEAIAAAVYSVKKEEPERPSLYKAVTAMYNYATAKVKDAYNYATKQVKKAKQIVLKKENSLRVLVRGWVRNFSVHSGVSVSKTPYGKPHDPTLELLFYEMMELHY